MFGMNQLTSFAFSPQNGQVLILFSIIFTSGFFPFRAFTADQTPDALVGVRFSQRGVVAAGGAAFHVFVHGVPFRSLLVGWLAHALQRLPKSALLV